MGGLPGLRFSLTALLVAHAGAVGKALRVVCRRGLVLKGELLIQKLEIDRFAAFRRCPDVHDDPRTRFKSLQFVALQTVFKVSVGGTENSVQ
jgi:hypothetical protein